MSKEGFSSNLRRLLKERRLTIREVSQATGIPISSLGEWCHGRAPKLSPQLVSLARFLGVTLEALVLGEASPRAPIQAELSVNQQLLLVHNGLYRLQIERVKDDESST